MNFTPVEQSIFEVRAGDVLMTEGSGSRDTVGTSAVWRDEIPSPICFQNTLLRLRPRAGVSDGRFLAWWGRHARGSGQIAAVSSGANILHIGSDGLKRLQMEIPALEEQRQIADFLDDRVSRIDRIVAGRHAQVEGLEDAIARLSFDCVRGASVEGPRRHTVLEWLGVIPSDWAVLSVNTHFSVELGKMLDEKKQSGDHSIPYLRNTNVQWDRVEIDDLKSMDIAPGEYARFTVTPGDLLICEGGQPGRSAIWDGDLQPLGYQKALHRARSRGESRPAWLLECLRVAVNLNVFSGGAEQTTIAHLTNEQLRGQRFPFPSLSQQDPLLAALEESRAGYRSAMRAIATSIDLLTEYKSALITAAVTGELDVTTAGSGIPE
ncbi:MAG: restriction endonuclease subunit S [Gordonia sp. (in: high G+C Gram-positive bacteria)]